MIYPLPHAGGEQRSARPLHSAFELAYAALFGSIVARTIAVATGIATGDGRAATLVTAPVFMGTVFLTAIVTAFAMRATLVAALLIANATLRRENSVLSTQLSSIRPASSGPTPLCTPHRAADAATSESPLLTSPPHRRSSPLLLAPRREFSTPPRQPPSGRSLGSESEAPPREPLARGGAWEAPPQHHEPRSGGTPRQRQAQAAWRGWT